MSGFTKLFGDILYSSIWQEADATRLVWVTLLAMADREGVVRAALPGIAHAARVSPEATAEAMEKFQSPDPQSRSQDYEGRRVERVDGGWRLLNYEKYRGKMREADRMEYKRVKQAEYRQRDREAPERDRRKKAIMAGKGTLAERLTLQAEKDGDQETLEKLERMNLKAVPKPEPALGGTAEAYRKKVLGVIEQVQAEAEPAASEPPPSAEGAETDKFPEV